MIRGTLAAAVTPLAADGESLDLDEIGPYADFLASGGLDGVLALGTTGEGILLTTAERRQVAEAFLAAAAGRLDVAVHCGAQTTRETVELAAHAAERGAQAVAVIGPPYFAFDEQALLRHFAAAAASCAPTPFYLYEFQARAGYAVPLAVIERLRELAPNLRGLKVSDTPWERFEQYLLDGLDVFAGPEALIQPCLARAGAGAVSGLAAAFPEIVARQVAAPSDGGTQAIAALRDAVQRTPFQATLKHVLGRRGLTMTAAVRAPLRGLEAQERAAVDAALEGWLASSSAAPAR